MNWTAMTRIFVEKEVSQLSTASGVGLFQVKIQATLFESNQYQHRPS